MSYCARRIVPFRRCISAGAAARCARPHRARPDSPRTRWPEVLGGAGSVGHSHPDHFYDRADNVPMTVKALKASVIDSPEKSLPERDVLDAISAAEIIDRQRLAGHKTPGPAGATHRPDRSRATNHKIRNRWPTRQGVAHGIWISAGSLIGVSRKSDRFRQSIETQTP